MVFSSPVFLFLFLPACLACAFLAAVVDRALFRPKPTIAPSLTGEANAVEPPRQEGGGYAHPFQNAVLLIFSLVFYVYGSGSQILIMLAALTASWISALLMERTRFRIVPLLVGVLSQLLALGYFKYANWFVDQANAAAKLIGAPPLPWTPVLLPIGISFFIFQSISYVIDVFRGEVPARKSILDLALYIVLFPQLIAGPIVRYSHVAAEIDRREATLHQVAAGASRFVFGLWKKIAVADSMAMIADASFALKPDQMTTGAAILGSVVYTFQIYFDFSAYSDMAIGIGHMFGFKFPENFNRPLTATSITDFWRRWHMTLSSCFRDYVYVPLGGSRGSSFSTYRNLWIVFLLSGLWHGASWTFVAWGAYHGAVLTVERIAGVKPDSGPTWRRGLTFVLVVIGFTLFRADSFGQAMLFYKHMFVPTTWTQPIGMIEVLTNQNLFFIGIGIASLFLPLSFVTGRFLEESTSRVGSVARFAVVVVLAVHSGILIASANFSPFIYFRF